MDWTEIIKIIVEFVVGGGLVAIVTIRDKKTEAILGNMQTVINGQREMMDQQKSVYDDIIMKKDKEHEECKAEWKSKEQKYEASLARKDDKIERDHKIQSSLRHCLDESNTSAAVNEILRCVKVGCEDRDPPLIGHLEKYCKKCVTAEIPPQDIDIEEQK